MFRNMWVFLVILFCWPLSTFSREDSDVLDEFRIEEGESEKLVLIQVHHEELVGGRQIQLLGRELLVKVADVFAVFLLTPNPPNRTAKRQPSKRSANIIPVRAYSDSENIIKRS